MASPQHPTKAVWQWHSLSRNTHNASVKWHKHTHARTMCQPSVRQYVNTSQTRVLNVAAALSGDSQRNCSLCFYLWTTLGPGKLELDTSTFAISHFKGVVRDTLETEHSTFNCDGNSDSSTVVSRDASTGLWNREWKRHWLIVYRCEFVDPPHQQDVHIDKPARRRPPLTTATLRLG